MNTTRPRIARGGCRGAGRPAPSVGFLLERRHGVTSSRRPGGTRLWNSLELESTGQKIAGS